MSTKIVKIISGGQTGADRGGLDAAIELGIPHGGWCPAGRKAEDGIIPEKYNLQELYSPYYIHRTEQNVIDSDITVVFTFGLPQRGSKRTLDYANVHSRPGLWVDMNMNDQDAADKVAEWIMNLGIPEVVLNVAGSRASTSPYGLQKRVCEIITYACIKVNRP